MTAGEYRKPLARQDPDPDNVGIREEEGDEGSA